MSTIWSGVATPDYLLGFPTVSDKFSIVSDKFSSFHSHNMNSFLVSPMSFTEPATPSVQDDLDVFRKVKVNIPLLEAILKILAYVESLKTWYEGKEKSSGREEVSENISALLSETYL
ncbi:MAG: hypothetical protein Q8835_02550 [Sweet potato little leaf phytoplasma]|nr:hypothetical protein [Sweet potato little leaf phytoplasma]